MHSRILNLAAAGGLALAGSPASAIVLEADDASIAFDVYFSGATASAQFVKNSLVDRVCEEAVNTATDPEISYYEVDADDWVIVCKLPAAIDASERTVRFIKQGGGSGDGTSPVQDPDPATPILAPVPAAGFDEAADCGAPTATATGAGTAFVEHLGCVVPNVNIDGGDIGTSDVEPGLFFDVNTPSTGIPFPTNATNIEIRALAGLSYGIGVTTELRNALQALQFPSTSSCYPGDPDHSVVLGPVTIDVDGDGVDETTVDVGQIAAGAANPTADVSPSDGVATVGDSEACMPNLTIPELAGIFTGQITLWNQIQREGTDLITAAGAAGVPVPAFNAVQALNNQRVHFCHRSTGSGTRAQFNAEYMRRPCSKIGTNIVGDVALDAGLPGSGVFNQSSVYLSNRGSSDLGRCLDDLDLTGNTSGLFDDADANPTNNTRFAWGIGYQSVEKNPDLGRSWRFVKVDGLAPTLQNVYLGDYTDHYEQTCQRRTSGDGPIDSSADATVIENVFDEVCTAGPVDIFDENQNFLHPWGQAGWLTTPDGPGGSVTDAPTTIGALMDPDAPVPVNSWTRFGVSCAMPKVVDPVQSTQEGDLP